MTTTKFRVPYINLYMNTDGSFSPVLEPGDHEAALTKNNIHFVEAVYHGQSLQQLDFLNNSGKGKDDLHGGDVLESVLQYIELLTLGVEYFEYGKKLNDWITGTREAPDPILENLKQVHLALNKIQDFNLAAWSSTRDANIAFLVAHSSAALHTANAFVQTRGTRNDPVWAAKIAIAERDSLLAVQTFSNDINQGYWLRPESIQAISWAGDPTSYYSGWMPHLTDRAETVNFKQVWDHRWALPALTYAIAARLAVMKIFTSGSLSERRLHCREIKSYVKILGSVFSKMWSGIRILTKLSDLQVNWYRTTGQIPMAAADIYGGYYLGGIFYGSGLRRKFLPPHMIPPGMIESPSRMEDVEFNVRAFAYHWWNLIYLKIGLSNLFLIISELDALCNDNSFLSVFAQVGREVRYTYKDDLSRKFASAAVSLSGLKQSSDTTSHAILTHSLYQALRSKGKQAGNIVSRSIRDLTRLAEPVTLPDNKQLSARTGTDAKKNKNPVKLKRK